MNTCFEGSLPDIFAFLSPNPKIRLADFSTWLADSFKRRSPSATSMHS
jgi:hypothetical protein